MNSDDVINGFASIMDVVFQFNDPDPLLITRWYQILALPMDFYQKRPEYLGMGLQRILTDLKTTMTIDENVKPSFFSLGFYLLKVFFFNKKSCTSVCTCVRFEFSKASCILTFS